MTKKRKRDIPAIQFKEQIFCKCKRNCSIKIDVTRQKALFKVYYENSNHAQKVLTLVSSVTSQLPVHNNRRRYFPIHKSKKKKTRTNIVCWMILACNIKYAALFSSIYINSQHQRCMDVSSLRLPIPAPKNEEVVHLAKNRSAMQTKISFRNSSIRYQNMSLIMNDLLRKKNT